MNKYCDKCSYRGTKFCSEMSKKLPFPGCLQNSGFNKAQSSVLEEILNKEYNSDTSVRHSEMNDDIVRTASNKEDAELQNKESVR